MPVPLRRAASLSVLQGGPLREGLVFAQAFDVPFGATRSPLDATLGVLSGTTKPSAGGDGLLFPGGASTVGWVSYGTVPSTKDLAMQSGSSQAFSVFARVRYAASNNGGGIVERSTAGLGWALYGDRSQIGLLKGRAGANFGQLSSVGLPATQWTNLAVIDPGGTVGLNTLIYRDGAPRTVTTNDAGSGNSASDASAPFTVGRSTIVTASAVTPAGSFNGRIAVVYVWRRRLTQAELLLLEVDPWALFQAPQPLIVVANGAALPPAAPAFPGLFLGL